MTWDWWVIVGLSGQGAFSLRFLVQWVASEKKGESTIPIIFWYLSLVGGAILLVYALYRKDPVFIIGQATGVFIYVRNLMLIHKKESRKTMSSVGHCS